MGSWVSRVCRWPGAPAASPRVPCGSAPPPSLLLVRSPGQEALRLSNTPCLQCSRSTGVFTPGSTFFHLLSNLFPRVRTPSRSRSRYPVQPPDPASRPFPVKGSSSLPLPGPSRGLTGAEVNGTTAPPAFWTDASKGSPSSLWAPHFPPSPGLLVDPLLIKPVLPWGWGAATHVSSFAGSSVMLMSAAPTARLPFPEEAPRGGH